MTRKLFMVWTLLLLTLGCSHVVHLPADAADRYRDCVNAVDVTSGKNRLVVYLFGSPPLLLKKDVIRMDGFFLDVYRAGYGEAVYTLDWGEIERPMIVDYADFANGIIRLTTFTMDPRTSVEEDVPFVEESVTIASNGEVKTSRRILLSPETGSKERIEKLFSEIEAANRKGNEDKDSYDEAAKLVAEDLGHLRNMSFDNTDEILSRMKRLPQLVGDCACEHMKEGYIGEVALIKEILEEKRHLTSPSTPRR